MVHLQLQRILFAFLMFPLFLVTAVASPSDSEPCPSGPNLEPGARLDEMVIEGIEICGTFAGDSKLLKELMASKIEAKPGDRFDPGTLKKDFQAVWSLGRVDTMHIGLKKGKRGIIVVFEVAERG